MVTPEAIMSFIGNSPVWIHIDWDALLAFHFLGEQRLEPAPSVRPASP